MDKRPMLLIIEEDKSRAKDQLGFRVVRKKILNFLSASGTKVLHDSGGSLIVVDVPERKEKSVLKNLPGARLIPVESNLEADLPSLSTNESLFLSALKKRNSKDYRELKRRQQPGETPEEKQLLSGSCVREEL